MRAASPETLLRGLGRYRVVLVYGDDTEPVAELARRIVLQEAGSLSDAFAVSLCDADDLDAIRGALRSPAFFGKRRVVWVREAADRLAPLVTEAWPDQALLVLEAGALTPKSKLRSAVEASPSGCAVAGNAGGGASAAGLRGLLAEFGVQATEGAARHLAAQVEAAGGSVRMVALRAALYAAGQATLAEEEAAALGGDSAEGRLENAMLEGLGGDAAALDAAVTTSFDQGGSGITLLRAALIATQRARGSYGGSRDPAVRRVRDSWSEQALDGAGARLQVMERAAKTTGMPTDLVGRMAVLSLGAVRRNRRG
jgi:DNA polymerase-3 subunit delta